jgi:hypothetical protein
MFNRLALLKDPATVKPDGNVPLRKEKGRGEGTRPNNGVAPHSK